MAMFARRQNQSRRFLALFTAISGHPGRGLSLEDSAYY
jgi:hypothetical protein